ncbi:MULTISPECIES: chloride channel protein [unclassified Novosphingobium]|uniref:chloride channel protein n=1 Tax=unclassified Novosphingobium TaxID=2644732 RepID=UPI001F26D0AA|nr:MULTISPECIES: chloride channel protein [unclassified Novosphingobium]
MTIPAFLQRARPLADHSADTRMLLLAAAALVIGTGGALGACVLLKSIAVATNLFWFGRLSASPAAITDNALGLWLVAVPIVGSLIVGLMARFGSDKIRGHGIPEAIEAILYGESRLSFKVALLKPLSSAISIGSGGPFGAEGPIIMTGGAIGSLFAQAFHLSAAERKSLLVAGAAAGMTAIFGTPIAAILLAIEVLLFEWKPRSFVPVVVGVLTAWLWRPLLIDTGPLFPAHHALALDARVLGIALIVGILTGTQAALLSRILYKVEDQFARLPLHWMWWPAVGGLAVGLGGLIDVHVLGAGYDSIQGLLSGSLALRAAIALLAVKAAVWLIALGSGTSGGVLAPLLLLGGALGYLLGEVLPGGSALWALAGMAGILSGAMRAPLMAALFAVELTGDFAMLPLTLAASVGAYAVSVLVMPRSILTEKIARRGRHILQEYTVDPFEFLQASQVMSAEPETLPETMTIAEAIAFFGSEARHRSYPVVDGNGLLQGLVSRSDVLGWRLGAFEDNISLAEVLGDVSQPHANPRDPVARVADLMVETGVGRIPVVDPVSGKVVGILTRHDLLKIRHVHRGSEVTRSRGAPTHQQDR